MENDYSDMLSAVIDQRPTDFSDAFLSVFQNKIETAINNKKVEIARSMYGNSPTEETFEVDSED